MFRISPLLFVAAMGCAPQSATLVEGAYVGFFPAKTSRLVLDDKVTLDEMDASFRIDCSNADIPLSGVRDICNEPGFPKVESWMETTGYEVVAEALEPWRGEAIMTSEGDFQLTMHHLMPGGEDFRFAFVINPNFQPEYCTQADSGDVELTPVDGDWVTNWSTDLDGSERYDTGRLFYLNAFSFQINPTDTLDTWILPQEWRAGYARAKIGPEEMVIRTSVYGHPRAYTLASDAGASVVADPDSCDNFYTGRSAVGCSNIGTKELLTEVQGVAADARSDFELAVGGDLDALGLDKPFLYHPMVHGNEWRGPADIRPAGLDGWMGMHYNWVRFDSNSAFEVGGTVSGEFFLSFEAIDSLGRLFVQGTFEVPSIQADTWTTEDLNAIKLAENGTEICGEPPPEAQ